MIIIRIKSLVKSRPCQGKKMTFKILQPPKNRNSAQSTLETKIDSLGAAAQFSIFAIRVWSSAAHQKMPLEVALGNIFADFQCTKVLNVFDECMTLMAVAALRKVNIGCCPSNEHVVGDEAVILKCFRELERGDTNTALSKMDGIIISSLKPTFCRTAQTYVKHLNRCGLAFKTPNVLSLV